MFNFRLGFFLLVPLLCAPQVSARQNNPPTQPRGGRIYLDVVVTPKSGPAVSGLQQQDFTILDNEVPQAISSFEVVDGRQVPIEVILLLDVVNTRSEHLDMLREGINSFLKADEGRLAYPTKLVTLTNTAIQFQEDFSQDGNAISTALDQRAIALRDIGRSSDSYGAAARFQLALQGLRQLVARESESPGRKLILWFSPGLPVLSGSQRLANPEQEREVFGDIVDISTQLREFQFTLYTVDPLGTSDIGSRVSKLEPYLKGVSKQSDVRREDLALQVIATQSGGLALNPGKDIAAQLQQCVADAGAYYKIAFDPAVTDRSSEYHHLEIRVANPGLTARTRQGYYSRPCVLGLQSLPFSVSVEGCHP
jgi:VWFA-related protein